VKVWRRVNSLRLGRFGCFGFVPFSTDLVEEANILAERDYEEVATDSVGDEVEDAEY
jgi:hypothetical protein